MYLLKHFTLLLLPASVSDLHSTMYLLKLFAANGIGFSTGLFTFHYVSIKTYSTVRLASFGKYLHSTMYLLKLSNLFIV